MASGGCGQSARGPAKGLGPSAGAGGDGGGFVFGAGGDECNIEGLCGNEVHQVQFDAPNIYFVIDSSGSMQALEPPTNQSRYRIVRDAAVELINSLGTLINVGAALFPAGDVAAAPCTPGQQVLELTPGDPPGNDGQESQLSAQFRAATNVVPYGGTPISATMDALQSTLAAYTGNTIVMLLTDGGPNCNESVTCDESSCMPHIEGDCSPGQDCCAASNPMYGSLLCVDQSATVARIQAINDVGIPVYVIGIPGSQYYAGVLDAMAVAGGTDQNGSYHVVDDIEQLGTVFAQIAAAAISCELPLADPPEDTGFTNVYFDCDVVGYDPAQGWHWVDDNTVKLNGAACQELKSGGVAQVTIATGCPTELPK